MIVLPLLLLLLVYIITSFGRTMPFTLLGLSCCLGAVVVALVLDELYSRGPLVNAELQNRFWGYLTFTGSSVLFYSPDSPIGSFGYSHPLLSLCFALSTGAVGWSIDRYISKQKRSSRNSIIPSKTSRLLSVLPSQEINTAKDLRSTIEILLNKLNVNPALKFTYRADILATQAAVIHALRGANRIALNFVLLETNLQMLFYKVRDKDVPVRHGPKDNYRTQLIELLCTSSNENRGGRLDELDVRSRALVIATLQESNLLALENTQRMVVNIIQHTKGQRLTNLKMLLDDRCSVHSLHKLVWHDIKNTEYRLNIVDHISRTCTRKYVWEEVAQKAVAMSKNINAKGNTSIRAVHRKILSDVDDTFFSSGGRFPAGCDTSYPRHELYPGVLSVYRELDVGGRGPESNKGLSLHKPGNLTFLSARPHVYRDVVEKSAFKRFKELIARGQLHCAPTMLAGSLGTGSSMFWVSFSCLLFVVL
jgi:hypothetical protein